MNAVTSAGGDASSYTVSHTPAGDDRLLTVCVVIEKEDAPVVSVTLNGSAALTKLAHVSHKDKPRTEIWYLRNPAATAASIRVALKKKKKAVIGVMSFTGVSQAVPIDGTRTSSGKGSTASVNVSSASGDLVVDCMGTVAEPKSAPSVGAGQTRRWSRNEGGSIRGAGSTQAGATSATLSWRLPKRKEWASVGFNVNAASSQ